LEGDPTYAFDQSFRPFRLIAVAAEHTDQSNYFKHSTHYLYHVSLHHHLKSPTLILPLDLSRSKPAQIYTDTHWFSVIRPRLECSILGSC
jgi:hypothetical protein